MEFGNKVLPSFLCFGCDDVIKDRHLLSVDGRSWHESCVKCSVCQSKLSESCYVRNGALFCWTDYVECFGTRCAACERIVRPDQSVFQVVTTGSRDAQLMDNPGRLYFHESCFACYQCGRSFQPGDRYLLHGLLPLCLSDYMQQMGVKPVLERFDDSDPHGTVSGSVTVLEPLVSSSRLGPLVPSSDEVRCKQPGTPLSSNDSSRDIPEEDELYELDSDSGSGKNCKRPRTILTSNQRRKFKSVFEVNPKPARKVRETLAQETGLNIRVVQVWFQNQRAKMKKLARRQAQGASQQVSRKLFPCLGFSTEFSQTNPTFTTSENGIDVSSRSQISHGEPIDPRTSIENFGGYRSTYFNDAMNVHSDLLLPNSMILDPSLPGDIMGNTEGFLQHPGSEDRHTSAATNGVELHQAPLEHTVTTINSLLRLPTNETPSANTVSVASNDLIDLFDGPMEKLFALPSCYFRTD